MNGLSSVLTWTRTVGAPSTRAMTTEVLGRSASRAGAGMAVAAMTCVQLGLAASIALIDRIGAEGAAWLRLAWAGVLLLIAVRPQPTNNRHTDQHTSTVLG